MDLDEIKLVLEMMREHDLAEFELERDGDRRIANAVIDTGKRIAPSIGLRQDAEELYWYFLLMAAALLLLGVLFVRDRLELWLQLAGGALVLMWASSVFNG